MLVRAMFILSGSLVQAKGDDADVFALEVVFLALKSLALVRQNQQRLYVERHHLQEHTVPYLRDKCGTVWILEDVWHVGQKTASMLV